MVCHASAKDCDEASPSSHDTLCTNQRPRSRLIAPSAEVRVEVSMLSMCPTTSAGLPKQTHSMTVFLPQRLGLESFLWAQAESGEPQNGLAGSCRPSGQILTSLLRYGGTTHVTGPIHRVLGFQRRQKIGIGEIMSLREDTYSKLPKRGIKGCAGCCTCVRLHFA